MGAKLGEESFHKRKRRLNINYCRILLCPRQTRLSGIRPSSSKIRALDHHQQARLLISQELCRDARLGSSSASPSQHMSRRSRTRRPRPSQKWQVLSTARSCPDTVLGTRLLHAPVQHSMRRCILRRQSCLRMLRACCSSPRGQVLGGSIFCRCRNRSAEEDRVGDG